MDNEEKKNFMFYLGINTMDRLDQVAKAQRRNRSTQIAYLVDQAYASLLGGIDLRQAETDKPAVQPAKS